MSQRFTAETDITEDTYVHDTETDTYAWFGDTPIFMTAEIADGFNLDPASAERYAWVDGDYNLVKGP